MLGWLSSFSGLFLSWWGAFLVSAIDSSVLFVLPFGNDALIVYLVASNPDAFWLYPIVMTAGSLAGTAATYWVGHRAGEAGLPRLASSARLERLKRRVDGASAGLVATAAVLPPPFPLTPLVLTLGALDLNRVRFFVVFGLMRLVRFGAEAYFAHRYGKGVLQVLQSGVVQTIVVMLAGVAVVGTIASAIVLWRRTRKPAASQAA